MYSLQPGYDAVPKASSIIVYAISIYAIYTILVFIYRVTLHPLARFPGPKLAAGSFWYEFYYDLFPHKLRYLWKIEELHKRYGPIVRINPIHLHINDPDYLDEIYARSAGQRKRNRDPWYYRSEENGPLGWSVCQTVDHDLHRKRRGALSPFFSKASIRALEPMINVRIDKLAARYAEACRTSEIIPLLYASGALTMDIISVYAFDKDSKKLDAPDWAAEELEAYSRMSQMGPFARQFPWVAKLLLTAVPPRLVAILSPAAALIPKNRAFFRDLIESATDPQRAQEVKTESRPGTSRTIFHEIIKSDLTPQDKAPARLAAEANLLLIAGTETTARTLAVIMFHLLDNPNVLRRLRAELAPHMECPGSVVPLATLEGNPYFVS